MCPVVGCVDDFLMGIVDAAAAVGFAAHHVQAELAVIAVAGDRLVAVGLGVDGAGDELAVGVEDHGVGVPIEAAAGDLQKQLESANAALAAEQERARAIEEKLDAAQRKNDPEMVECNVVAKKLRADFNSLLGWVKKISVADREKGEKMLKFLRLLVKAWAEALGMEVKM